MGKNVEGTLRGRQLLVRDVTDSEATSWSWIGDVDGAVAREQWTQSLLVAFGNLWPSTSHLKGASWCFLSRSTSALAMSWDDLLETAKEIAIMIDSRFNDCK